MRRPLVLVMCVAATGAVNIAQAGNGSRYSGITTTTFQQGVSPTSDYAGCEDTFISSNDSNANFGGSHYLRVGGEDAPLSFSTTLIRFDISALPDSAVIIRARLWFYQTSEVGAAEAPDLHVYRIFNTWTEGTADSAATSTAATYNNRTTVSWNTAGAKFEGPSNLLSTWQASGNDTATVGTVFTGTDTANYAPTLAAYDRPKDPLCKRTTRGSGAINSRKGWLSLDVTHQVELWHVGANSNNGFLIQGDEEGYATPGELYWCSSEFPYALKRPKLEVTYFDPTSGSSGVGGGHLVSGYPWNVGPR